MRRLWEEAILLVVGIALGTVLIFLTSVNPVNHPTAWVTWGYPLVWRSAASASPGYYYPLALYQDIAFWLLLSLVFVEYPIRTVTHHLSLPSSGVNLPPSRSALVVASAIIIAAVLLSTSVLVATSQKTTTESLTTTFTSVSTLVTTVTSVSTALQTTSTTTDTCSSDMSPCGSFTYTPTGSIQVNTVQAAQYVCQNCGAVNGQSYISFTVDVENTGNSTVYIAGGSDELSSSVPANSTVIHEVTSELCAGTFQIVALNQGQNYTLYAPGCDSGIMYQLAQAGTVEISLSFHWATTADSSDFPDATTVSATFIFS